MACVLAPRVFGPVDSVDLDQVYRWGRHVGLVVIVFGGVVEVSRRDQESPPVHGGRVLACFFGRPGLHVDRLAEIPGHVVHALLAVADVLQMHDEGITRYIVPGFFELWVREKRAVRQHVQMNMPVSGVLAKRRFDDCHGSANVFPPESGLTEGFVGSNDSV